MDNKVLLDALEYAWTHPKRNNTFTGDWSYLQLAFALRKYSTRIAVESNRITGIVVYEVLEKVVHVRHILCDTKAALRDFLLEFKKLFPEHKIASNRGTKLYGNTDKLVRRLYGR